MASTHVLKRMAASASRIYGEKKIGVVYHERAASRIFLTYDNQFCSGFKDGDNFSTFWIALPGVRKEEIKVTTEKDTVKIQIEDGEDSEYKKFGFEYAPNLDLSMAPDNVFKLDEMKAEMKDGVLNLVFPKNKEEIGSHGF